MESKTVCRKDLIGYMNCPCESCTATAEKRREEADGRDQDIAEGWTPEESSAADEIQAAEENN